MILALLLAGTQVTAPAGASATAAAATRMRALGTCIAERQPARAAAALALDTATPAARARIDALVRDNPACNAGEGASALNLLLLSGAMAEQLLGEGRSRLGAKVSGRSSTPGSTPADVATCMAIADAGAVSALLATEPTSEAERGAFAPLGSALVACATKGTALRVPRSGMRALLAIGAYRLVSPASAPAQGSR